jgi:uncharacterized protein YejL (UPF0352 family)
MKNLTLLASVVVFVFFSAFSYDLGGRERAVLSDYQKDVVTYFKEVALGFEFGEAKNVTRKWRSNMKIYVAGNVTDTHKRELQNIISELNQLITDNFNIEIVDTREESNFYLYIGTPSAYSSRYPIDAQLAKSNSGVYRIYWNQKNQIVRGHMFVNTVNTSEEEQRHVLREELTQSLGLGRDSDLFPGSIFQASFSTPTSFSQIDRDIIRLLYHPQMSVGLSDQQVEALLTEILLSESGA